MDCREYSRFVAKLNTHQRRRRFPEFIFRELLQDIDIDCRYATTDRKSSCKIGKYFGHKIPKDHYCKSNLKIFRRPKSTQVSALEKVPKNTLLSGSSRELHTEGGRVGMGLERTDSILRVDVAHDYNTLLIL